MITEKAVDYASIQELYDGKCFCPKVNSKNGEANEETLFSYHQKGNIVWAEYMGGEVVRGNLIGTVDDDGTLNFYYHHINQNHEVRIGKCHSVAHYGADGKLELHEEWQWLNADKSSGSSVLIEK